MLLFYLSLIETEEDKSKFERLYNQYKNLLKYVAIDMLHDDFLAEDAVHEAFIKLARHINGVDEQDEPKTKAFVIIIVKSVCSDMIRKEKKKKEIYVENIDDLGCSNNEFFENLELEDICSVISSLPDTYREIIQLKLVYNLNDKEISDVLGISNAAVRKRMQRARGILRNKLSGWRKEYVSV